MATKRHKRPTSMKIKEDEIIQNMHKQIGSKIHM